MFILGDCPSLSDDQNTRSLYSHRQSSSGYPEETSVFRRCVDGSFGFGASVVWCSSSGDWMGYIGGNEVPNPPFLCGNILFAFCYRPQTKLWEGNVFTLVCDSVHRVWSLSMGGLCPCGVSVRGISVRGISVSGVSVREGLYQGGVSIREGSLSRGSLSRGASVYGGGVCHGDPRTVEEKVVHIQCRIQDFSEEGTPTYDFAKISQKLHEIERIWTGGGAHVPRAPLRSATDILLECILLELIQLTHGTETILCQLYQKYQTVVSKCLYWIRYNIILNYYLL